MTAVSPRQRLVDRESPVPAYHQLARALRGRIERGDWTPGSQLPPEIQLADEYSVSRSTVRQALTQLADDRYVKREQGRGTFALEPPRLVMNDLSLPLGLAHRSRTQGFRIASHVLSLTEVSTAPEEAASALGVEGPFVELSRQMVLEDSPAAHVISWLPSAQVPGLVKKGLVDGSVSQTLSKKYKHRLGRYDNQLQVVGATAEQAELLDVMVDEPLILLSALCTGADGTPLEYSRTYWRADRVRLRFGVDVDHEAPSAV